MSDKLTGAEVAKAIQEALLHGELSMKTIVEQSGWTYPRVRSKARTVAKKLGGSLEKRSRGVYAYIKNETPSEPVEATTE